MVIITHPRLKRVEKLPMRVVELFFYIHKTDNNYEKILIIKYILPLLYVYTNISLGIHILLKIHFVSQNKKQF